MSTTIKVGDYVILKTPSTNQKMVVIKEKGSISLGKFGSFPTSDIIGKPYGVMYEILNERAIPTKSKIEFDAVEETEANNQLLIDDSENQKMTFEEIETLKNQIKNGDKSAKEAIEHVVANHSKFEEKTEYAKAKYIKRKEKKFLRFFVPLVPSTYNICEFFFKKNPSKIKDLRMDTLSQILSLGNTQPNLNLLVVDDTNGMLTSSVLDRMGGLGNLFFLFESDFPNLDVMRYYNFDQQQLEPLFSLRWDKFDKEFVPEEIEPLAEDANENTKSRYERKLISRKRFIEKHALLHKGEFDGLFIATSSLDPYPIITKLSPLLAFSRPIVVYSMYKEILLSTSLKLKQDKSFLNTNISESWLRKYQVLPGRTHPEMSTSAQAGYILSTTTVLDLNDSTPINSKVINSKKAKME